MRILIFNWRDIKNPHSGGAEILTHEMAKRWTSGKHNVVVLSSLFAGAPKNEYVDGVRYIRAGSSRITEFRMPVHFAAIWWYRTQGAGLFDVVIDEIHGIPFFTPLYVREKVVALICEVAKEIWDTNYPFPLSKVGRAIEANYFRLYKKVPFLTISPSTRDDVVRAGIPKSAVTVVPMGLTAPSFFPHYPKERHPTLIFVGRLHKSKGVEDALSAVAIVRNDIPDITLWIVGQQTYPYVRKLKQRITMLGISKHIVFWGFVDQQKKYELMNRAHALIAPSMREGWGLTVPEAGFVGTPAIVYDVAGLRDIIHNGVDGFVVQPTPHALATAVRMLITLDKRRYGVLQREARKRAKAYDWDQTAKRALDVLHHAVSS